MINKITVGLLLAVLFVGVRVSALEIGVTTSVNANVGDSKSQVNASATSTVKSEGAEGDAQKSAVAKIVASLLADANRDGGIGADVRLIAQEQASTSAQVKEDMDKLNSESKVKVFLFGPNYRSLGDLRSSIVTTQNHIARLKKAQDKTTSASVKADLEVQIQALQVVASSTEAFVKANESKLSVLGWFVHIFVR